MRKSLDMLPFGVMRVLGIYIDQPFLRISLVEKTKKQTEVIYLKSFLSSEPENVKQLYNLPGKGKIASALGAKHLLIRPLHINTGSHDRLEEIIAFQSDATSHFNAEDILSVPLILKKDSKQASSILFTAQRKAIESHLGILSKWQLDPDLVTGAPIALIRYAQWKMPGLQNAFLVDLGSEEWTCVAMENGEPQKCYSISGGTESLLSALWEDRKKSSVSKEIAGIAKQIDLLQLQPSLNKQLSLQLHHMKQELARTIYSFFRLYGQRPLFFTGRLNAFGQMREYLLEQLKEWVSADSDPDPHKEERLYAIPIGLAIGYQSPAPQFRRGEFFSLKNWKRAGIYSLGLILFSLGCAGGMLFLSQALVSSKTNFMKSQLQEILSRSSPELIQKIFIHSEIEEILYRWGKAVTIYSRDYPYILNTPKVSEMLSWLYQHPLILELEKDPIEIHRIGYQLLRYPHIDAPKDPYLAKVELEFSTKSALKARKFHEALIQGEGPVDATQDIQWDVSDHQYHVSFFLKPGAK